MACMHVAAVVGEARDMALLACLPIWCLIDHRTAVGRIDRWNSRLSPQIPTLVESIFDTYRTYHMSHGVVTKMARFACVAVCLRDSLGAAIDGTPGQSSQSSIACTAAVERQDTTHTRQQWSCAIITSIELYYR